MEIKLNENERIDDLEYRGLKIIQNKEWFCFGIDSIILTNFAKESKKGSTILDLGTGTGVIAILLSQKIEDSKVIAIEIQRQVSEMAQRSVKLNNLENNVQIINEDINNISKVMGQVKFDVVITNPPYKEQKTGIVNENKIKMISRHEVTAKLEDFIRVASEQLKDYGNFYMINRPERIIDIFENLRKFKLEPKEMQFIYPKKDKSPNAVLVRAVKYGRKFLKIREPLIVYNDDGTYTEQLLKIYEK